MKNAKIPVNDFIEEYEEKMYDKYRSYKNQFGRFSDLTNKVHAEWKSLLKFIYDYEVDGKFTLEKFKAAIDDLGSQLSDLKKDPGFPEYWAAISTMYYFIEKQVAGVYENEIRKAHK